MERANNDLCGPAPNDTLQDSIDLINEVLRNSSPADRPYYERILRDLYEERKQTENSTVPVPGPSDIRSLNRNHSSSHLAQMPSPAVLETTTTTTARKRSLGLADVPEAKRVSNQPSPVTPTSETSEAPLSTGSQHRELPSRPSIPSPTQFIDLTVSDPPSPLPVGVTPASHSSTAPTGRNFRNDPFAELVDAYQPNGPRRQPVSALDQNFMGTSELAEYVFSSTPSGSGYAFQQQRTAVADIVSRPVPYVPGPQKPHFLDDSDSEEYGDFPITGADADALEKLLENIGDHEASPEERVPTPATMSCRLKEYQKIGLTWMLKAEKSHKKGGILADEMGLGKTVQALSLICANPPMDPRCKTTLIIAPVALMRQWEKEIERHIRPEHRLKVYLYHGPGKKASFRELRTYDVVLTTFGTLTSEFKAMNTPRESALVQQELRNPDFRRKGKDELSLVSNHSMFYRIIIDEAHNIKNRNALCSKATEFLQAEYRLCMTGTPMMNSVDELYPLLRFLRLPQYIDWSKYNLDIARLVKDKNEDLRKRGMHRLQILLKSVMLRRQKTSKVDGKEVCTIPPKETLQTTAEFSDDEHAFYKALEQKSRVEFNKYAKAGLVAANYAHILVLLLRLRQACCHPHLIKDLSQAATSGISDDDLLLRAQQLNEDVIRRLVEFESFECPICLEADLNPTIIIPCGHTVCGDCVQRLIDPARQDGADETTTPRCPHCRGELKAKFITDYKHFCQVHCPQKFEASSEESDDDTQSEDDSDSEIEKGEEVDNNGNLAGFVVDDEEDEEYKPRIAKTTDASSADEEDEQKPKQRKKKGKGKNRAGPKKNLAQLKKESLRSKAAKKQYLRRLDRTYIPSAKTSKIVELLEEIRNNDPTEKTLIFSQFTSLLDLVEIPLYRKHIEYQRYDGSMKMDDRADAVNAFMDDPNMNVMLVSLKAGNAGLNLWKASQVIILDPFWNPFIEDQAVDRAHRMPQPRKVTVHRVLIPETVEDRICAIQDAKREIVNTALDEETSKGLTRLGLNELRYLFGMST
ncbi:hypothetical protein ACN47E_002233 [Coniothyrium glycines]